MRRISAIVGLFLALAGTGCDSGPSGTPAARDLAVQAKKPAPLSPAQTAVRLHELFAQRSFGEIAPLVLETQRGPMIYLLVAVDQVLSANQRLRKAAEKRYGGPMSETWSIGEIANNLGPFSADLQIIDQEVGHDGRVIVVLREGENVPLYRAEFVQVGTRWQYQPAPVAAGFVSEVDRLAAILNQIAWEVEQGETFAYYLKAFGKDVYPQMRKIMSVEDVPALAAQDPDAAEVTP